MTFFRLLTYGLPVIAFWLGGSLLAPASGPLARGLPNAIQIKQPQPRQEGTSPKSKADPAPTKKKPSVHLRGVLVEGGAECQRFRASDNRYYTLEGDLHGFHSGDSVEITGTIPQGSHCMQDTTIRVQTIRRAEPPSPPTK